MGAAHTASLHQLPPTMSHSDGQPTDQPTRLSVCPACFDLPLIMRPAHSLHIQQHALHVGRRTAESAPPGVASAPHVRAGRRCRLWRRPSAALTPQRTATWRGRRWSRPSQQPARPAGEPTGGGVLRCCCGCRCFLATNGQHKGKWSAVRRQRPAPRDFCQASPTDSCCCRCCCLPWPPTPPGAGPRGR